MPKELRAHPFTTMGILWYAFFLGALLLQTFTDIRL